MARRPTTYLMFPPAPKTIAQLRVDYIDCLIQAAAQANARQQPDVGLLARILGLLTRVTELERTAS